MFSVEGVHTRVADSPAPCDVSCALEIYCVHYIHTRINNLHHNSLPCLHSVPNTFVCSLFPFLSQQGQSKHSSRRFCFVDTYSLNISWGGPVGKSITLSCVTLKSGLYFHQAKDAVFFFTDSRPALVAPEPPITIAKKGHIYGAKCLSPEAEPSTPSSVQFNSMWSHICARSWRGAWLNTRTGLTISTGGNVEVRARGYWTEGRSFETR
jgi:hypothetical protein